MTFSVVLLWAIVFVPTVAGFAAGTLFAAPCLTSIPDTLMDKIPRGKSED